MPSLETPPNPAPTTPPPPDNQPLKVVSRRFGELEHHELIQLLDSIDDEVARARFRESIYISIILCLAMAWFAFYGPRILFHSGRIANPPQEVTQLKKEMPYLDMPPSLVHKAPPKTKVISDQDRVAQTAHPVPKPARPSAGAPGAPTPAPQPAPPQQAAQQPQPRQPQQQPAPQPQQPRPAQNTPIPDAPRPSQQTSNKPNFAGGGLTPGQSIRDAANAAARGAGGNYGADAPSAHSGLNSQVEILSDTLGVDFGPYIKRLLRILYNAWVPLIPEETRPPLNKEGSTLIRFTINPDGTLQPGGMHLDASTHDEPIDRAAWGAIVSVGQFPPLPKNFNGPNLQLRINFIIARNAPRNDF